MGNTRMARVQPRRLLQGSCRVRILEVASSHPHTCAELMALIDRHDPDAPPLDRKTMYASLWYLYQAGYLDRTHHNTLLPHTYTLTQAGKQALTTLRIPLTCPQPPDAPSEADPAPLTLNPPPRPLHRTVPSDG